MVSCIPMAPHEISEAFLAAPSLISKTLIDLSIQHPNWMRDMYEVEEFPRGNGTAMQQLVYRGALPQVERGFDLWRKMGNNSGCNPDCSPDCSYNWTQFGGHGLDRKIVELMTRDFRSPSWCVTEIQTTADFETIFAKSVETLYKQTDFFKEVNIGQNVLTMVAKKYVVDSNGPQPNTQDPYTYRPIGAARISALNITLLEFFYEQMRRATECVSYDLINGSPIFALECSHQLLAHLYRDDPNLRQDVRFSGMANDLLTKYNFMSTIRGMFIAAPILYPRRFNVVNGVWTEILPFINGIPAEVGAYTGFNQAYEQATHEEVLLHGKYPFKIFYMPTEQTLGQNTSFGPESGFFNSWQWVNPPTVQDPFRRVGFFATGAKIGISQQYSEGVYGILVERPSVRTTAVFAPEPECPPTPVDCSNAVPAVGCPCPMVLSATPNPVVAGQYIFTFQVPIHTRIGATIQLGLDSGGYLSGTVVAVSSDLLSAIISFTGVCPSCTHFVSLYCNNTLGCSSDVVSACACQASDGETGQLTAIALILKNPIKANTNGAVVTVYFCDGTSASAEIESANMCTNTYVISLTSGNCLDNNNIVSVCVPPSTDASCQACGQGPTITYCS